ncbi:MAG: hypothetical protein IIX28_03770 [Clostridia bacterium]|nr:hypothetical protein [Clostridia bacterium]
MLKPRNKAANVITAIVAVLLSILLVVLLFATAIMGTANSMTTPEGLGKVVNDALQNVDFEQIIVDSAGDMNIDEEDLKEAQIINRLLKTDAAEEIIDLFAAEIAANLNRDEGNLLNDMSVRKIVHEHADEIVDVLYDIDPSIDRETIREEMLGYVDENADELVNSLMGSVTESIGSTEEIAPVLDAMKIALIVLVVLCVVLAGGIYGCRYYRFGGFLWVGIDTAVAGLLTTFTALAFKSNLLSSLVDMGDSAVVVAAATTGIGGHFMRTALLMLGVGVLLIGLFILLKCTVVNPKVKAAKAAEELPAAEA